MRSDDRKQNERKEKKWEETHPAAALGVAALAARRDFVPVAFPLFPPGKRPVANHTDLRGKIPFGDRLALLVLHAEARCRRERRR